MATKVLNVKVTLPATVTSLDDGRWRVASDALGVYGYGDTIDNAVANVEESINLMADALLKTQHIDAFLNRFMRAGVEWEDVTVTEREDGGMPPSIVAFKSLQGRFKVEPKSHTSGASVFPLMLAPNV